MITLRFHARNFAASSVHRSRSLHIRNVRSLRNIRLMDYKPLSYGDGPMVWVDCEMTGLDPDKDKILEIAVSAFFAPWPMVWNANSGRFS
jgi:hypothetical protein